jgi:hypothetical protein
MNQTYTSTINAGLGLLDDAPQLLKMWQSDLTVDELRQVALQSGQFPNMSARRLRNFIIEGFGGVFLAEGNYPAKYLQNLAPNLNPTQFSQIVFIHTCRRHAIINDFVHQVYWQFYAAGRTHIQHEDARQFVECAVQDGVTTTDWTEGTIKRVARYLLSYCADFGLVEQTRKQHREILPFRIQPIVSVYLAYDLHFQGVGDNALLTHKDWGLFGLERADVLEELRRMALQKWLILQTAGGVTRIDWLYETMEDVIDGIIEREF